MAEHGVRYAIVRVRADNVTEFKHDIEDALVAHKVPVPYSAAKFPAFKEADVVDVMLGYEYDMLVKQRRLSVGMTVPELDRALAERSGS
jgi:hypothetical protein